jgi:hypothetical protein
MLHLSEIGFFCWCRPRTLVDGKTGSLRQDGSYREQDGEYQERDPHAMTERRP